MKLYLKNISIFLFITLLLLLSINWVNKYIIHTNLKKNHTKTTTLILGDSHARWINEQILPNSINLFQGGDTYKSSYYKLKKMIEVAPHLDKVILTYDYHNLGPLQTEKINCHKESIKRIAHLAPLLDMVSTTSNYPRLIEVLFQQNFSFNYKAISSSKNKFTFDDNMNYHPTAHCAINHGIIIDSHKDYKYLKTQDSVKYHKKIEDTRWYYFNGGGKMGHLTLDYLEDIVKTCKSNDIQCYIISMPIDPDLAAIIPKKYKQKFEETIAEYKNSYGITYLDYRSEFDQSIEYFENPDHITAYGGALISEKILDTIDQ